MNWIKCSEQHPPYGIQHRFLFINGKGEVTFGYAYDPKDGWEIRPEMVWINDFDRETNEVASHWMPLPKPQEEE